MTRWPQAAVATAMATTGVVDARADVHPVRQVSIDAAATLIVVTERGGRERRYRPDTPGDTFGPPQVSADRTSVGWTVQRTDGASYPYPTSIAFEVAGRRIGFACAGGMPWAWHFAGPRRAVVDCAFPHGPGATRRALVDVTTGHTVASVMLGADGEVPATAPGWARPSAAAQ